MVLAGRAIFGEDIQKLRQRIVGDCKSPRPLKIVVDSGNGVPGASSQSSGLYWEVDGAFPNHHLDPSEPENRVDLIAATKSQGADLDLAFDGDRLGVVMRDGHNIYPDAQIMLFAKDVLSRVPGGEIIFDVKCSQRQAGRPSSPRPN